MDEPASVDELVTKHLDYLLGRDTKLPEDLGRVPSLVAPADHRALLQVSGVALTELPLPGQARRLRSEDLLIGLHGQGVPVAFQLGRLGEETTIGMGAWWPQDWPARRDVGQMGGLVVAGLRGLYPSITAEPMVRTARAGPWPRSGLALGIPTAKPPEAADDAWPVDRLVRALVGVRWEVLVLAAPVAAGLLAELRDRVLNQMRLVRGAAAASGAPSPLADYQVELLGRMLTDLSHGFGVGGWRTAAYLLGDEEGFERLAALWRGTYAGEASAPEPVRIWESAVAADLADRWAMPQTPGAEAPGPYRRPFLAQTILTSRQLAAYIHLPQRESAGFRVSRLPRHDVVPPAVEGPVLRLGEVVDSGRVTATPYQVTTRRLTRHALVAGITGSGKTTTIVNLLVQAAATGVPFLVIEPAKAEYRALLEVPGLGEELLVFSLGDETVAPLRLNPFEVPPGIAVGVHLDLLRSAFVASFGMWTPLPQVLERCLHEIYEDRGWDLVSNHNRRLDEGADRADAFPTLSQLADKVDEVIPQLGYEDRITADFRAALHTRLNALRTGGKGRMLDTTRAVPPLDSLFTRPVVVELQQMGDAGDIAFVAGLLLIRLAEHRRAAGPSRSLRHLLVIEEAHRLLTAPGPRRSEEEADPRGAAVETFTNLLAELRAYGQGVVVADQIPVKLSPDVLKNTDLKVAHRTVAADDRLALAGAMAMQPAQGDALATLPVGRASVFGDGDDGPLLVQMPRLQSLGERPPSDDQVRDRLVAWHASVGNDLPPAPTADCGEACRRTPRACQVARQLVATQALRRTLSRILQSTFDDAASLDRQWPDLLTVTRALRPAEIDEDELLRCLAAHGGAWYADHRGAQAGWPYGRVATFSLLIRQALEERIDDRGWDARGRLVQLARQLHARPFPPFAACEQVCRQDPPVCLYRHAVADLIQTGALDMDWYAADAQDTNSEDRRRLSSWDVSLDAGYELMEFPEDDWPDEQQVLTGDAARRASLCFAQQMLATDPAKTPRDVRRIMDRMLEEAQP
jgi:hypothetical protein